MNTMGFNEETLIVLSIAVGNKYIFTIEEALAYMIGEDRVYYLEDMMFHNVPVRDAIRNNGLRTVADTLSEYAHGNEKVKARLDEIVRKYSEKPMADFDIQVLPVSAELKFFGKTVTFDDIKDCIEIRRHIGSWISECERKNDALHVANIYAPYPCFDSYDYANETRCYDNYIIRNRKITEQDCMEIEASAHDCDYNYATDRLPCQYLPLIYHNGDSNFMLVVTEKEKQ